MAHTFSLNSMICGYHEYSRIWNNPIVGEELACELGNSYNPHTVAAKKTIGGESKVVGHVSRSISAISSLFIRREGKIQCEVKGIVDTRQICLKVGWKYHVHVPCIS